jgi:hypothetical protein
VVQARTDLEQGDMATTKHVAKINLPGIWINGKFIRTDFMHKEDRHRHTLGLEPTKANLKHAARLRIAALHARGNLAFYRQPDRVIPITRRSSGSMDAAGDKLRVSQRAGTHPEGHAEHGSNYPKFAPKKIT